MKLTFHGAAGTVTGSSTVVTHGRTTVLVDCGLFQGVKRLRRRNRGPFPVLPHNLDAVVLTHAHLDHSGLLPRLVAEGFKGPIYCSRATRDLCHVLWPDSAFLQESEADYANRKGFSRHHPALPLYTQAQAAAALKRLKPLDWGDERSLGDGLSVSLRRAGHLLGAASAWLRAEGRSALFSGDVGRPVDVLMRPPVAPPACDALILESTYGNRVHPATDPAAELAAVVRRTAERGGILLIPAFAVGRSQALLHLLAELRRAGRIPRLPVFLNSPMAIDASELYQRHCQEHRLDAAQCQALCQDAQFVRSVEESRALTKRREPAIILSASGMAVGGRVLHHLKALLGEPRHTVLFVGFQAPGTRGEQLLGGAPGVKIHGAYLPVRAEIARLHGLSAHADQEELLAWARRCPSAPRRVLLNHGEPAAADALRARLAHELGWDPEIPELGDTVEL